MKQVKLCGMHRNCTLECSYNLSIKGVPGHSQYNYYAGIIGNTKINIVETGIFPAIYLIK